MPLNFPTPTTTTRTSNAAAGKSRLSSQSIAAFSACYERFEDCREFSGSPSASSLAENAASFVLDFDIIAKRAIGTDTAKYRLFQMHFLHNADRKACCSKLQLTEWTFASEVLAIKRTLGDAFAAAGLFPLAPYFSDSRLNTVAA